MNDLFSEENLNNTELANASYIEENQQIQTINKLYSMAQETVKPKNLYATVLDTKKRTDMDIEDFGNVIPGAKKYNWKTMKFSVDILDGLEQTEIDKYLVKDRVIDLSEERLIREGYDSFICLAAPMLNELIPKKPNFDRLSLMYSNKNDYCVRYINILKFIEKTILESKDINDLKKLSEKFLYKKYNIENSAQSHIFNFIYTIKEVIAQNGNMIDLKEKMLERLNSYRFKPKIVEEIEDWINKNIDKEQNIENLKNNFINEFEAGTYDIISKKNSKRYALLHLTKNQINYIDRLIQAGYPNIAPENLWLRKYNIESHFDDKENKTKYFLVELNEYGENKTKYYDRQTKYSYNLEEIIKIAQEEFTKDNPKIQKTRQKNNIDIIVPKERESLALEKTDKTYTEEHLLSKFKLWGVQFGNYQNQKQLLLDNTVVSLNALSDILKIKPENLSLGGNLGLAYGARGSSKALAHYECNGMVINLTKKGGAGALAHEYGHALDHLLYISASKNIEEKNVYLNEVSPFLSQNAYFFTDMKNEIFSEIGKLMQDVLDKMKFLNGDNFNKTDFYKNSIMYDRSKSKPYWSTNHEMFARCLETYISDKLDNINSPCPFLVYGIDQKNTKTHSAFPCGPERDVIFKALDNLIDYVSINQDIIMEPLKNIKEIREVKNQIFEDRTNFINEQAEQIQKFLTGKSNLKMEILNSLSDNILNEIVDNSFKGINVKELDIENLNILFNDKKLNNVFREKIENLKIIYEEIDKKHLNNKIIKKDELNYEIS